MAGWLLLCGLTVAVHAPAAAEAAAATATIIVPGTAVGPLKLGMTRNQATLAMRAGFKATPVEKTDPNEVCWLKEVCARFSPTTGVVESILVTDTRFETMGGVRVGSPGTWASDQLQARLGQPRSVPASDGYLVSWPGLQVVLVGASSQNLRVSSLTVTL